MAAIWMTGETPLDPSESEGLRIKVSTRAELNRAEALGVLQGVRWANREATYGRDLFDDRFWIDAHRVVFQEVWDWAGQMRITEKSIGIEPYRIGQELRRCRDDARFWYRNRTFRPLEFLARLHHRLVWIHPFPNGNGRHARVIADVVGRHRFGLLMSWGRMKGNPSEVRSRYLQALRAADQGDFSALIDFMTP